MDDRAVDAPLTGTVAPGWDPVRDAVVALLASDAERGAGVVVQHDGEPVVGLAAGWADVARTTPWAADTLVHPYSVSKPFAAVAFLTAVRDGLLGLDDRVADHWPAYGVHGKDVTTVRDVLAHRAGQPAFPPPAADLEPGDTDALIDSLAGAEPILAPGTSLAEHAFTYGHLLDGVLRASGGGTLAERHAALMADLGLDAHLGVPDADLARVAEPEEPDPGSLARRVAARSGLAAEAALRPPGLTDPAVLGSREWQESSFGAVNVHLTARAVAGFYADLPDPDGRLAHALGDLWREVVSPQAEGDDLFVGPGTCWGLGPQLDRAPGRTDGPFVEIGMGGLGGSAGWCWPAERVAVGYVTRYLVDHARVDDVEAAVRRCL